VKIYYSILLIFIISCNNYNDNILEKTHTNVSYEKATEYRERKILDSAFLYYNNAKEEFLNSHDSIGAAKALINMSVIMSGKGDFYGSIETAIEARKVLTNKDSLSKSLLASNLNTLAISSKELKNFTDAITYYKEAINLSNEKDHRLAYLNNIGDSYLKLGENETAILYFQKSLKTTDSSDYARALNNLGKAENIIKHNYSSLKKLEKALFIRIKKNDEWGLNSSFASLSDFYLHVDDKKKSLFYANEMYKISKKLNSPDDQIEALQKLILLEKPEKSKSLFKIYHRLNDSIHTSRGKSKNQFALIRFETEKNKADNLKLQKDNTVKKFQFYGISIFSLSLTIFGIIWYKKRRQRLLLESENRLKEQQLKTSKKVHDVVANGIYQVMTKIENQENFNKNEALDELEFVYEKSRDISYEKEDSKNSEEEFKEKISNLIASFKNSSVETYVAGNENKIWNNLSSSTGEEIYQIMRELLVNMKKHSKADRVVFKFERINNFIKIQYTDNGIGISGDLIYKNGLSSTVSRIEKINGEITFDIKTEKGLKINISFPIS